MKRYNVCIKNARTCDVQNLKASLVKAQSKPTTTQTTIINHTSKMHETFL